MIFELIKGNEEFSVLLGGAIIIKHSKSKPFIFAGIGRADYKMNLGNFHIKDYVEEKVALRDFEIEEKGEKYLITLSNKEKMKVILELTEEDGKVLLNFNGSSKEINRLWIRVVAEEDEYIYGCGEQYSYLNLRGRNFPLWVSEQGVGRNKKEYVTMMADKMEGAGGDYFSTYFPQPTYISSRKYFCHVNYSSYMDFDFSKDSYHELQIWGVPESIVFQKGDSYVDLVSKLTSMLGRQKELPEWVYDGVWLGVQGGTEATLNKLQNALDKGIKVSAIWAQDWEGKRITYFGKRLMWNWQWDRDLYPNLDKEIVKLKKRGIRFLGYINPYLAIEGNLFKEASENKYLVKNPKGEDYVIDMGAFKAGTIDLTYEKAYKWYKEVIKKNMIDFGLSGWMADFAEYLPVDAVVKSGVKGELVHNLWPVLWAKCNREAIEESGNLGEIVFFTRSGYSGSGKYTTMQWAGDQNVNWGEDDGLPSVITSALSLGMSGVGLHHSDIGGYTTLFGMKRTKELFMRWAEMGTFAPIMRTHEGNRPEDNFQFDSDEETLSHYSRMSKVYVSLKPYLKECVKENAGSGIPVMRPLFMHYEGDTKLMDMKQEFLLGRDLLVAPVLKPRRKTWKVYLPRDKWVHLWTGKEYEGGDISINAPLGYPPVFYRKGTSYTDLFKKIALIK